MTTKADFNAEEWATLVEGPLLGALQVVAAERGGTIRESLAIGRAYAEARKHHGDRSGLGSDDRRIEGRAREAQAYKQFILTVAESAANANREGGFIGIGGKPVSASEQAALDELRQTLSLA